MAPLSPNELRDRADALRRLQQPCRLCPRQCGVARPEGFCQQPSQLQVATGCQHFGEEPCLAGSGGAGTIFVAGCTMRCLFCQNHQISQTPAPRSHDWEWTAERTAHCYLELQGKGAHNIEWVSATQHLPTLVEALAMARASGLLLPVVLNSNGYETIATLELLEGVVDLYLPDAKYGVTSLARRLSKTPDYVAVNRAALVEMWRQVGPLELDGGGLATRGLLIRHLVLPGQLVNTREVLRWISEEMPQAWISVMAQYCPAHRAAAVDPTLAGLTRRLTHREYDLVLGALDEHGLERGWIQELKTNQDLLPDFQRPDPFGVVDSPSDATTSSHR